MATQDQRLHAQAIMAWLVTKKSQIGYQQSRPMKTFEPNLLLEQDAVNLFQKGDRIALDCSEMITLICRWAGWHDPSGPSFGFDGYGNSSSMFEYLPQFTDASRVHLGTIVAFGPGGADHVAMVMAEPNGGDPLLFSHGSSAGPISISLSQYQAAEPHQRPVTFLAVAGL